MDFLLQSVVCLNTIGNIDTKKWLTGNQDETLARILQTFGKTKKQLDEDIRSIKDWMRSQRHLPEAGKEKLIKNFLLVNKCNITATKEKLDMYYSIRHMMPEVFDNTNINMPHMKKIVDQLYFFPLPRRTEESYRVTVCKIVDSCPDNFDFNKFLAYGVNSLEVRLEEDLLSYDIFVLDMEHIRFGHIFKISPFQMKKMVTVLEKVYSNKIKKCYMINCPSFAVNAINVLKQLIKPKLASRILVDEGSGILSKNISLKILPRDYGGLEMSLSEMNEMWKSKLEEHKERFNVLDTLRTNEKLRPSVLENDEILGYHGNFRKLALD